jgi:hypothetical protein
VHAANAQGITTDRDGGVWIGADSVTRYDSAGRATHVVVTDDRTRDVRT